MRKSTVLLMLAGTVAVAACQRSADAQLRSGEYVGCYDFGFESGFFAQAPVHSESELWFVVAAPDSFWAAVERMHKPGRNAEVFLRVRAELGPKGPHGYGHLGLGKREMRVQQVLELRPNTEADGPCFPPPPSVPSPAADANNTLVPTRTFPRNN